jgi:hypothetical protein
MLTSEPFSSCIAAASATLATAVWTFPIHTWQKNSYNQLYYFTSIYISQGCPSKRAIYLTSTLLAICRCGAKQERDSLMRIMYLLCFTFSVHFACATWTEEVYGLQQPVLHLDVFVNKNFCAAPEVFVYKSLCCTWTCLSTKAFVLLLGCLSTRACAALMRVWLQELLCCTWTCLSSGVLHLWVSVYKSFVVHLDVSAYKSPAHAVPGTSVCFEKSMFVPVNSIHVRNTETTETNRKNRVSVLFGSNQKFFCLFRGHPSSPSN